MAWEPVEEGVAEAMDILLTTYSGGVAPHQCWRIFDDPDEVILQENSF